MSRVERIRVPGKMERQRATVVGDVIRWGGGFGWKNNTCHVCDGTLTAQTPDGRWSCPWHWPVTQMELFA